MKSPQRKLHIPYKTIIVVSFTLTRFRIKRRKALQNKEGYMYIKEYTIIQIATHFGSAL